MRKGFTLLELVMVLTILAVLLTFGVVNWQRFRANLELRQAQQVFVQTLIRARSDARRLSQDQIITWTDQVITVQSDKRERDVHLTPSPAIRLKKVSGGNRLVYEAPYGRLTATNFSFDIEGRFSSYRVYVYGITGKVASGAN